ncbi:MAG: hypothetical protein RLZZ282_983 [Verrucomicrobiota bacterium]
MIREYGGFGAGQSMKARMNGRTKNPLVVIADDSAKLPSTDACHIPHCAAGFHRGRL